METHLEKKFYVPKISEFHVDFEFEFNGVDCNWNQTGFDKHKILPTKDDYFGLFTLGWVEKIYYKPDDPLENWIRVKYLDKEDIEELGWDHDYNAEPIPNRKELPVFEGYIFDTQRENEKCWILYLFSDGVVWIDYIYKCGGQGYVFKGLIRNKSELKKVMEMVGITLTTPAS